LHLTETAALPGFGIFDDGASDIRPKVIGLYTVLIAVNLLAWTWAFAVFCSHPLLLATAFIAYGFGLRHAVDADHIAAIDNVTRKLMQEGKRPIAVGFFPARSFEHRHCRFSAHSRDSEQPATAFSRLDRAGGSDRDVCFGAVLFAIAIINIVVLTGVYRLFRQVKAGQAYADEKLNVLLAQRGVLGRLLRALFRLVSRGSHMYPLGLLFGLGFDTATEIGLLSISAAEAAKGLSIWCSPRYSPPRCRSSTPVTEC
jgi:high-affinity nickel-transport protein